MNIEITTAITIIVNISTLIIFVMNTKNKLHLLKQELELQTKFFNSTIEQLALQITLLAQKIDEIDKKLDCLNIEFAKIPKRRNDEH